MILLSFIPYLHNMIHPNATLILFNLMSSLALAIKEKGMNEQRSSFPRCTSNNKMLDNVFMYNSAQTQSHRFSIIFFSDLFFHLRYFFRKVRSVSLSWNSSHELMERTVWMCSTHSVELPLGLVDKTVTHHLSSRFYTNMELRDIQTRDC